tara:strand:- start:1186 stop:1371 length:186 start_codon:yes stop_codon:yes gene_type:complete
MDIGNCYLILMRSMVGGYNHFELRNYRRAYTLPSSNGNPGFSAGSVNPAMLEVETWIRRNL